MAGLAEEADNLIHMDRSHTATLNLAVLQRIDPLILSVVATASHVAIYSFNDASKQWEKRNIDGACFVVERLDAFAHALQVVTTILVLLLLPPSREGHPQHRVVVMNRTSRSNLVIDVVPTLQLKLVKPYLMFKDSAKAAAGVNGIWFQDEVEGKSVTTALARLLRPHRVAAGGDAAAPPSAAVHDPAPSDPPSGDVTPSGVKAGRTLLSMLQAPATVKAGAAAAAATGVAAGPVDPTPTAPTLRPPSQARELAPAAAALFSSFAASQATRATPPVTADAGAPRMQDSSTATTKELSRAQLRTVLLELLDEEAFVAALHDRYLETARRGPVS